MHRFLPQWPVSCLDGFVASWAMSGQCPAPMARCLPRCGHAPCPNGPLPPPMRTHALPQCGSVRVQGCAATAPVSASCMRGRWPRGCAAMRDVFHRALRHDAGRLSVPAGLLALGPCRHRRGAAPLRARGAVGRLVANDVVFSKGNLAPRAGAGVVLQVMSRFQREVSALGRVRGLFCKRSGVLKGIPSLCKCYNACKVLYPCESGGVAVKTGPVVSVSL